MDLRNLTASNANVGVNRFFYLILCFVSQIIEYFMHSLSLLPEPSLKQHAKVVIHYQGNKIEFRDNV